MSLILACTGHRPNKLGNEYDYVGPYSTYIEKELLLAIEHFEPVSIVTGMAVGVDTIWARCGIKAGVNVLAFIPCEGQEKIWPKKAQELYHKILSNEKVTPHIVSPGKYSPYKMQVRNERMVDACDVLIAVWDGTAGGTGNCVNYARSKNKPIYRIDPRRAA